MKKQTKVSGKYQRRYASGLLMYRERKNLVEIPAGKMVTVLKHGNRATLCQHGKDGWMFMIPNENLPAFKGEVVAGRRKGSKNKPKKTASVPPVVPAEPAPVTPMPVPAPAPAPAVAEIPVVEAEVVPA